MDCSPWRLWQIRPHLYRLSARAPSCLHPPTQRYWWCFSFALQKYKIYPELPNSEASSVLKSVKIFAISHLLSLSRSKTTNDRVKAME